MTKIDHGGFAFPRADERGPGGIERDGIETALVILAVLGTLAICLIVAAVHIGLVRF